MDSKVVYWVNGWRRGGWQYKGDGWDHEEKAITIRTVSVDTNDNDNTREVENKEVEDKKVEHKRVKYKKVEGGYGLVRGPRAGVNGTA